LVTKNGNSSVTSTRTKNFSVKYLIEQDNRHHQPVAHLRWSDGAAQADDGIDIIGARGGTDGFHEQIDVCGQVFLNSPFDLIVY
jgi:hypothetical protein